MLVTFGPILILDALVRLDEQWKEELSTHCNGMQWNVVTCSDIVGFSGKILIRYQTFHDRSRRGGNIHEE